MSAPVETPIVIIGSEGFAKDNLMLIDEINEQQARFQVLGLLDEAKSVGSTVCGRPVIGSMEWLSTQPNPIGLIIAIANPSIRSKVFHEVSRYPQFFFPTLISPTARLRPEVVLGQGCMVGAGVIFAATSCAGDFVVFNVGCTIGHDALIGSFSTISPGAHISGNVVLAEKVEVGTGASVIQGIHIGENAVIGAGAAVIRDIPPATTAVGVPAKPIFKRE